MNLSGSLRYLAGFLPSILTVVGILVVWQLVVPLLNVPEYILPLPSSVIRLLFYSNPPIPWSEHALSTLGEAVLGFGLAVAVGIPVAVFITMSRFFKSIAEPIVVAAQVVPKVAFVPILFLWLGLNILPRILTVFLVCFFPTVIDTTAGMALAEQDMIDLVRTYNPHRSVLLRKVLLPTALPGIFAGLKISITLAMLGAVVAEFVSSSNGLGFLILSAQNQLNTPLMFASATILVIMGFALYGIVLVLERLLIPWRGKRRW